MEVFIGLISGTSVDAIDAQQKDGASLRVLQDEAVEPSATMEAHQERLARLKTCEATRGVAPCKVGEIIMEGATEKTAEIWKSN